MPRSTRHKSSKHSSKDDREYSDVDKDKSCKERKEKGRDDNSLRGSRESGSGEKRKMDYKENKISLGHAHGESVEEYSSSKRHKERAEEHVNDSWNAGENEQVDATKKLKDKSEWNSKQRDAGVEVYGENCDEAKRIIAKSEGSRTLNGKERRDREGDSEREKDHDREKEKEKVRERDRERKGKDGKIEKLVVGESNQRVRQASVENDMDIGTSQMKIAVSADALKHQDPNRRSNDNRLISSGDVPKDRKPNDEKHEERSKKATARDDHFDGVKGDKSSKKAETCPMEARRRNSSKPCDSEMQHSRKKMSDWDHDPGGKKEQEHVSDHENHKNDSNCDRNRDRDRAHERDRDRDRRRDRAREYDRAHDGDRDWDRRAHCRDRDRNRDRDRERDHCRDDDAHLDARGGRLRDSRRRKRESPDEYDDYNDAKSRGVGVAYADKEKQNLACGRNELDADRPRLQSRQPLLDSNTSSNKQASPSTTTHGCFTDELRHYKTEDLKHRDVRTEQRRKISSRERTVFSSASDRMPKYRAADKPGKLEDGRMGDNLPMERSSSSKASPVHMGDRLSAAAAVDRSRYANKAAGRKSSEMEESGWRSSSSVVGRDFPSIDDRSGWDGMAVEKPLMDESALFESKRCVLANDGLTPQPPPVHRVGMDEDGRGRMGTHFSRSNDPGVARVQGNVWRGAPNWPSPMLNGCIFPHGLPPAPFPTAMPQFPSLFNMRPSLDVNQPGIPYHMPDGDRFSGGLRPLGWPSMMDGSGLPYLHGWDGNNSVFRDQRQIFVGQEWEHNRHHMSIRGWQVNAEAWKGLPNDAKVSLPSASLVDNFPSPLAAQTSCKFEQLETGKLAPALVEELSKSSSETKENVANSSSITQSDANAADLCRFYLSKLDISPELTDPELLTQCMALLNTDEKKSKDEEEIPVLIDLKRARAIPKNSIALQSSSFLPKPNESVFQKAMAMYKKRGSSASAYGAFKNASREKSAADEAEEGETLAANPKAGEQASSIDDMPNVEEMAVEENEQLPELASCSNGRISEVEDDDGMAEAAAASQFAASPSGGGSPSIGKVAAAAAAAGSLRGPLFFSEGSHMMASVLPESDIFNRIHASPQSTH